LQRTKFFASQREANCKNTSLVRIAGVSLPAMSLPESQNDERDVNSWPAAMHMSTCSSY
jgi:hypothetical protein